MPRILDIKPIRPGRLQVTVRPDGSAPAGGRLLVSSVEAGSDLKQVGTWTSNQDEDGSGEIITQRGTWIFAEQDGSRSAGYLLLVI